MDIRALSRARRSGRDKVTIGPRTSERKKKSEADTYNEQLTGKAFTKPRPRPSTDQIPAMVPVAINMHILSTEEKLKMSVRKITSSTLDPSDDNGVNSRWLGVTEDVQCKKCNQGLMSCFGHYGLIEFPEGVKIYHPMQMEYVILVLRSICQGCAEMLLTDDMISSIGADSLNGYNKLKLIAKHSISVSKCPTVTGGCIPESCSECIPNPEYLLKMSKDNLAVTFKTKGGSKDNEVLDINEVYKILSCISRETANKLGFLPPSHPKDLILESLLVPPVCVRFPMKQGASQGTNKINEKYATIVNKVQMIEKNGPTPDNVMNLTNAVKDIMSTNDNQTGKMSNAQGMSFKILLNGKKGAWMGNVTAKRTALSARTVITPEASSESDEAGIPEILAKHLTTDQRVTTLNREAMIKLLENDKITHINNRKIERTKRILNIGDTVTRHLQNGDYVMLNRQPSLSRKSMMAFRVKLIPGYSIRLHLSATTPYNADFDGDEMNLHVPQTFEAMSELREIASVKACMMDAKSNKPSVGLIYDAAVASFLLTDASTLVKETLFMDALAMLVDPPPLSELKARVEGQGQLFKSPVRSQIVIEGDADLIDNETFNVEVVPVRARSSLKVDIDSLRAIFDDSQLATLNGTRAYIDSNASYSRTPLLVKQVRFIMDRGILSQEPATGIDSKYLLYSDEPGTGLLSVIAGRFKIRTLRTGSRSIYFEATPHEVDVKPDLAAPLPVGTSVTRTVIDRSDYVRSLQNPNYELVYSALPASGTTGGLAYEYFVHHPGVSYNPMDVSPGKITDGSFKPDNIVASAIIRPLPGETITNREAYMESGSITGARNGEKLIISRVKRIGNTFVVDDNGTEFIVYTPNRKLEALSDNVATIKGTLLAKGKARTITRLKFITNGALMRRNSSLSSKGKERETRVKTSGSLLSAESKLIKIKSAPPEALDQPARLDMISFDRQSRKPIRSKRPSDPDIIGKYLSGQPLLPPTITEEPELPTDLIVTATEFIPENTERVPIKEYLVSTEDRVESAATDDKFIIGRIVRSGGELFFANDARSDLGPDSRHEVGYSGRALFSALLPAGFKYESKNKHGLEDVIIRDGVIIQGQLTKTQVGPVAGSIIQYLYKDFGQEVASKFITNAYLLLTRWLTENMFSTGISDCLPGPDLFGFTDFEDEDTKREMERVVPNIKKIKSLLNKKQQVMTKTKLKLESLGQPPTDPKDLERWTSDVSAIMNITNEAGLGISRDVLDKSNPFNIMYQSGGKGSAANISQMIAFASQQFLYGQVMPMTLGGGTRCLPYFEPGSTDPRARGFCSDSFTSGLDLPGWVFSMTASRPQILETVLRTADAGTLQRYMTTAMQDVKLAQDGTVRNSKDQIISFAYGGDNMDGSKLLKINTSMGMYRTFLDIKPEVDRLNAKYSSMF